MSCFLQVAGTQGYSATDLVQEGQLAALSQAISSVDAVPQEQTIVPAVTGNSGIQVGEDDDVNQAWFTTKEDKDSLHTKGTENPDLETNFFNLIQVCWIFFWHLKVICLLQFFKLIFLLTNIIIKFVVKVF